MVSLVELAAAFRAYNYPISDSQSMLRCLNGEGRGCRDGSCLAETPATERSVASNGGRPGKKHWTVIDDKRAVLSLVGVPRSTRFAWAG